MEKEGIHIENAVVRRCIKAVEAVLIPISTVYLGQIHPCRSLDVWSLKNFYVQPDFSPGHNSMGPLSSPLENHEASPSHLKKNW